MKKRYVAFIALATGIAGSALTYANTNKTPKNNEQQIVNSVTSVQKEEVEPKQVSFETFNYNKEDIVWLTSLIRYSSEEIKKAQKRDLSSNQAMEVIYYSTETLYYLKEKGQPLKYEHFAKSKVQYDNQEMFWLLKDLRNKNLNTFKTTGTSKAGMELVTIGDLSDNIGILEEKRLRENKEVVINYKNTLPTAIQVDNDNEAREKEWNLTKIYLNEINEKITGKYIDQEVVKKDNKNLREEQDAREVFNEALATTNSKLRF